MTFATPVAITANTTYVASYHTDGGHYSATSDYFATPGVDRSPLHALADGGDGGNGVYVYGGERVPDADFNATNYWVDVRLRQHAGHDAAADRRHRGDAARQLGCARELDDRRGD